MKKLKSIIANWLFPEVLETNVEWIQKAHGWAEELTKGCLVLEERIQEHMKANNARITELNDIVKTLKLAQAFSPAWSKELTKTMNVVNTPVASGKKKRSRA